MNLLTKKLSVSKNVDKCKLILKFQSHGIEIAKMQVN